MIYNENICLVMLLFVLSLWVFVLVYPRGSYARYARKDSRSQKNYRNTLTQFMSRQLAKSLQTGEYRIPMLWTQLPRKSSIRVSRHRSFLLIYFQRWWCVGTETRKWRLESIHKGITYIKCISFLTLAAWWKWSFTWSYSQQVKTYSPVEIKPWAVLLWVELICLN